MDYKKTAQKARNSIKKNGAECRIIRKGEEVYNKATDEYEFEEVEVSGSAILNNYDMTRINSTAIQVGDVQLMCVFDEPPVVGDILRFGERDYTAVNVEVMNPDGKTVIYYTVQAR